jgi:hypothetical protein
MSSLALTTEILREALHLEAERPTRGAGGDVDRGARRGAKRSASLRGSSGSSAGCGGCDGRGRHRRSCAIREVDSDRWPQGRQPNPANSDDHEVSLLGPSWLAMPDHGDDRLRAGRIVNASAISVGWVSTRKPTVPKLMPSTGTGCSAIRGCQLTKES